MLQLISTNNKLDGEDKVSMRRRNAFVNALTALAPKSGIGLGAKNLQATVRACLYAIAPSYLWQFFSCQGLSGSNKQSIVTVMPNIYKAVKAAVASKSGLDQDSVVSAISAVVRSCPQRAESKKYLEDNPHLVTPKRTRRPSVAKSKEGKVARSKSKRNQEHVSRVSESSTDSDCSTSSTPPAKVLRQRKSRSESRSGDSSSDIDDSDCDSTYSTGKRNDSDESD